jgi:hypothetical protein
MIQQLLTVLEIVNFDTISCFWSSYLADQGAEICAARSTGVPELQADFVHPTTKVDLI